jgi:hypothetical protein
VDVPFSLERSKTYGLHLIVQLHEIMPRTNVWMRIGTDRIDLLTQNKHTENLQYVGTDEPIELTLRNPLLAYTNYPTKASIHIKRPDRRLFLEIIKVRE